MVGFTELITLLIVGLVAGFLANLFVARISLGILGSLIVGVIGAFIGGYIFGIIGISANSTIGQIIFAFIGAALLLLLIKIIKRA